MEGKWSQRQRICSESSLTFPCHQRAKKRNSGPIMELDYGSEDGQSLRHAPSEHSSGEGSPVFRTAVDLETHAGLKTPPAKRVRRHSLSGVPAPSLTFELEDDDEEDRESDEGEEDFDDGSVDSFIHDIFHATPTEDAIEEGNVPSPTCAKRRGLPPRISKAESAALKAELHTVGGTPFMKKYVQGDSPYSVNDILYAFGYVVPEQLDIDTVIALFRMAVDTELRRRRKLENVNSLDDVVKLIQNSNNIMILAGAGISTSCGIPDFRSDTGIYSLLADYGLDDPQDMFDIEVFQQDPSIFYSFAKKILPSTLAYSPTHAFLRLLQDKDKLLRVYTQNIDNLEQLAGVKDGKLVQCHGSFATASCMRCKLRVAGDEIREDILNGRVPKCPACEAERGKQQQRPKGKKRRRNNDWDDDDDDEDDDIIEGIMKPDITFFGEELSKKFDHTLLGPPGHPEQADTRKCDLLICIGTSLKVAPVSEIIGVLPPNVPQIYISKTPVRHVQFDVTLLGSCDDIIKDLVRRCGYTLKHEKFEGGRSDVGGTVEWQELQQGVYEVDYKDSDTYTQATVAVAPGVAVDLINEYESTVSINDAGKESK